MLLSRRLSILLMLSVGINLFLAGVLVTQWLEGTPVAMAGPFNRDAAHAALTDDYRRVVQGIWEQNQTAIRDSLYEARETRRQIRQQLNAEVLDREGLKASFMTLRDIMVPLSVRIFTAVVEIAEALPVEERRRYFEAGFAGGRPFPLDPIEHNPASPGSAAPPN